MSEPQAGFLPAGHGRGDRPAALARLQRSVLAVAAAVFLAQLIAILVVNRGRFTYTLDDAYIHLSLAEQIARGQYGINPGEPSAPSSSILWPVLLVPFVWPGLDEYAPLLLNVLATIASLALIVRVVWESMSQAAPAVRTAPVAVLLIGLVLATNLFGIAFTGMEHSLQTLLGLALAAGLIAESRSHRISPWLGPVLVLGPLVRYENLALTVPAIGLLLWRGHRRVPLWSGAIACAALGAFSLLLVGNGLGWLPSSVLAKSRALSAGAGQNLIENLTQWPAALLVGVVVAAFAAARSGPTQAERGVAVWLGLAASGHLLAGRFGWFSRYEIYIWTVGLVTLVFLYRRQVAQALTGSGLATVVLIVAVTVAAPCWPYFRPLLQTPGAARDIHDQHYQLHRFATEFLRGPIAVYDIGWVSYRNEHDVLDLVGLASREALAYRQRRSDVDWMADLVARHGIRMAAIYWVDRAPRGWIRLGRLTLSGPPTVAADDTVTFFATDAAAAPALRERLAAFSDTLPRHVRLTLDSP